MGSEESNPGNDSFESGLEIEEAGLEIDGLLLRIGGEVERGTGGVDQRGDFGDGYDWHSLLLEEREDLGDGSRFSSAGSSSEANSEEFLVFGLEDGIFALRILFDYTYEVFVI